jgi:CO dehydrogenase/acetyl-CoA synthase beta subunit
LDGEEPTRCHSFSANSYDKRLRHRAIHSVVGADRDEVEQLKENVYRVEYRVSSFTSQEQLDAYLRRRCAELTLREGYDFFHLAQRADVLALSRRTSMTVTMYKGKKPVGADDVYDAKEVLAQPDLLSGSQ